MTASGIPKETLVTFNSSFLNSLSSQLCWMLKAGVNCSELPTLLWQPHAINGINDTNPHRENPSQE